MPWAVIRTGIFDKDGKEEVLREYTCDTPCCGNIATNVLGVVRELRAFVAVCDECYKKILGARRKDSIDP